MKLPDKKWITVVGAREHNLKDITVKIPKESLTVITGPSGSGKSSLALDILYAEGQRRYMESLSSYARQFLGMPKKPDFDRIDGLCPSIAIDQKTVGSNPRSTVGTITEIYDYLRVLYARIGITHCPDCKQMVEPCSPEQMVKLIIERYNGKTVTVVAPWVRARKGEFVNELIDLFHKGFRRFTIDEKTIIFNSVEEIQKLKLGKTYKHTIDVTIDAITVDASDTDETVRLQEAVDRACSLTGGLCKIVFPQQDNTFGQQLYSTQRMCLECGESFLDLEPRMFSFNSPLGACQQCQGIGVVPQYYGWMTQNNEKSASFMDLFRSSAQEEQDEEDEKKNEYIPCTLCHGMRLNPQILSVTVGTKNIAELCSLSIIKTLEFFKNIDLTEQERIIATRLIEEITNRLQFLLNVGLGYLSLSRTAQTLSGGEGQRIRLARQLGSALSGVLYILDEPSIGLHQRDNDRLIETLKSLRDLGNTVVVVEHDHDTMMASDYLIDMGPAAGVNGGQIIAVGTPEEIMHNPQSLTGDYLAGRRSIERLGELRIPKKWITLNNANTNNLKNVTVKFPLGVLCGISGVSGSGKSSLIMDELVPAIKSSLHKTGSYSVSKIEGVEHILNLVVIDQSPIGRTPRSNPATYLGIFNDIRALFAALPESKLRGYAVGRFSFNVAGGRCESCFGDGVITVSMHFLPDVTTVCRECNGLRYSKQTLEITYKGKNIAQVLDMTAYEAVEHFAAHAGLKKRLQLLCDVGLDYVKLGQPSTTLSGGEAQRIKLVNELAKRGSETLYILDEPTTGLHANDIERLLHVFKKLIDKGNSLIVIEHNLDVLKTADYLIDMGPEGGDAGGVVVAQGTPEQVAKSKESHTGHYLKRILDKK